MLKKLLSGYLNKKGYHKQKEKGDEVKVIFCATSDTLSLSWKESLEDIDCKRKIVDSEDELMKYLSKHNSSQNIVLLEDKWVGGDFSAFKEFILALHNWFPNVSIMVLSQYPNYSSGKEILQLGVKAYGNARMLDIHLKDAISCVKRGDVWVYPEFVQLMIKSINIAKPEKKSKKELLEVLSPREQEIVDFIYEGYSNKEIAQKTQITLRTVKAHTASIYEKLHVKDRIALVLLLKSA